MCKDDVNFRFKQGVYPVFDEIREDFTKDYLEGVIKTHDLRRKYGLSHSEYKELTDEIKAEHRLNRRPTVDWGKNYYPESTGGFTIKKRIDGMLYHIAFVETEEQAKELVQICRNAGWDVVECRKLAYRYLDEHGIGYH